MHTIVKTSIILVLIAVCIIGAVLLFTSSTLSSTKHGHTEACIQAIQAACENYEYDFGTFPNETNWYEELTGSSNAVINTNNVRYIYARKGRDGWQNMFVYRFPGKTTNKV